MEIQKQNTLEAGTWDKLPTAAVEKKPKVEFKVNIPVEVIFMGDEPVEFRSETGIYYVFYVKELGVEKVIMTSAWSLLKGLKILGPLKNKKTKITKKMEKGKQFFEVLEVN